MIELTIPLLDKSGHISGNNWGLHHKPIGQVSSKVGRFSGRFANGFIKHQYYKIYVVSGRPWYDVNVSESIPHVGCKEE